MGNDIIERFNRTLEGTIRSLSPKCKSKWPVMLRILTFCYLHSSQDHGFCTVLLNVWTGVACLWRASPSRQDLQSQDQKVAADCG